jgi:hypothetical protein
LSAHPFAFAALSLLAARSTFAPSLLAARSALVPLTRLASAVTLCSEVWRSQQALSAMHLLPAAQFFAAPYCYAHSLSANKRALCTISYARITIVAAVAVQATPQYFGAPKFC